MNAMIGLMTQPRSKNGHAPNGKARLAQSRGLLNCRSELREEIGPAPFPPGGIWNGYQTRVPLQAHISSPYPSGRDGAACQVFQDS